MRPNETAYLRAVPLFIFTMEKKMKPNTNETAHLRAVPLLRSQSSAVLSRLPDNAIGCLEMIINFIMIITNIIMIIIIYVALFCPGSLITPLQCMHWVPETALSPFTIRSTGISQPSWAQEYASACGTKKGCFYTRPPLKEFLISRPKNQLIVPFWTIFRPERAVFPTIYYAQGVQ